MKAIVHNQHGDASVLRLVDRDIRQPGVGEVRVRVVLSGINPTDWKSRSGGYGGDLEDELVPNQDGTGVVDALGEGVDQFAVGDRVWIVLAAHQNSTGGTAQEYTVVPVERVFPLPANASFELGASIGIPGTTAHRALTVAEDGPRRLSPGALADKIVLVAGGAGAVGHAAIQLARWAGATVISTVSSAEKAALATSAGAHHIVNYRTSDAADQVRSLAPEGVDLIVEVALDKNADFDFRVLKPRGTISTYASSGDGTFSLDIRQNMGLNSRLQFVLLYTVGWHLLRAAGDDINAAIADGALPVGEAAGLPVHYFPLEQTADAHRAVENNAVGKVLVRVTSEDEHR